MPAAMSTNGSLPGFESQYIKRNRLNTNIAKMTTFGIPAKSKNNAEFIQSKGERNTFALIYEVGNSK